MSETASRMTWVLLAFCPRVWQGVVCGLVRAFCSLARARRWLGDHDRQFLSNQAQAQVRSSLKFLTTLAFRRKLKGCVS